MANANSEIQTITFDISDNQVTKVTILTKLSGDYPIGMKQVYEKTFPARVSCMEILRTEISDYLTW